MALQIKRTTGTGPPTGLEEGQLAVELSTGRLWVGVPDSLDVEERRLLIGLPQVTRVRVDGQVGPGSYASTVMLDLSHPAPPNCWVQYWRYRSGLSGFKGSTRRTGFRPVGHSTQSNAWLPLRQIAIGTTSVSLGTVSSLFRPPLLGAWHAASATPHTTYSLYYRSRTPAQANTDLPPEMRGTRKYRDVKCLLKFGVILRYREPKNNWWIERRGLMSTETLKIQRWRYQGQVWALKTSVT